MNITITPNIYTLSLHDALPISIEEARRQAHIRFGGTEKYKGRGREVRGLALVSSMSLDFKVGWRMLVKSPGLTVVGGLGIDRKSTRLNSSHSQISYAVFCLKKK